MLVIRILKIKRVKSDGNLKAIADIRLLLI